METHYLADQYYNWYKLNLGSTPLGEYYFLPNTTLELVRRSAYDFELTCVHKKKQIPPKIDRLPLELLRSISSFLTYEYKVVLGFSCPNDYPFIPPHWQVLDDGGFILMRGEVIQHNYDYSVPGNWSMQSMEADILQMVVRIMSVVD
jgi:hypothetical protein